MYFSIISIYKIPLLTNFYHISIVKINHYVSRETIETLIISLSINTIYK